MANAIPVTITETVSDMYFHITSINIQYKFKEIHLRFLKCFNRSLVSVALYPYNRYLNLRISYAE